MAMEKFGNLVIKMVFRGLELGETIDFVYTLSSHVHTQFAPTYTL
jgi:hypothetical protein